MTQDKFTKIIRFTPGYDKRHTNPNKNYGIHGMDLQFVLKGPLGACNFTIFTNWFPASVDISKLPKSMLQPMGADLGRHSPVPIREDEQSLCDECLWLDNKPCYYDGSGLLADDLLKVFLEKGEAAVWERLEEKYRDWLTPHK